MGVGQVYPSFILTGLGTELGPVYHHVCAFHSFQSCLILCNPVDCSLPGFSVNGILQARILEWVAISSSRDLPKPGVEPTSPSPESPALQADCLPTEQPGKPLSPWIHYNCCFIGLGLSHVSACDCGVFFIFNLKLVINM